MRVGWKKILSFFLVITLPIIFFVGPLLYTALNNNFYEKEINKIEIAEREKAIEIKNAVLDFLKGKGTLETPYLNEKEKLHMQDVKRIFNITKYTFYGLLIFFIVSIVILILTQNSRQIPKITLAGSIITLLSGGAILIATKVMFRTLFVSLHKLIYSNRLWQLNPETDNLIRVFSEQFFVDMTLRVIIISSILAVILLIISIVWLKITKEKEKIPEPHYIKKHRKEEIQWK